MNRAERRKSKVTAKTVRINLAEWRRKPEELVTKGEAMALIELHKLNHHKPPLWKRLLGRG